MRKDISRKIRDYLRLDVMIMAGKSITYLGTAFKPQSGELSLKLLENFFGEIFFERWVLRNMTKLRILSSSYSECESIQASTTTTKRLNVRKYYVLSFVTKLKGWDMK